MWVTIKKIREQLGYKFTLQLVENGNYRLGCKMLQDEEIQGVTPLQAEARLQVKLISKYDLYDIKDGDRISDKERAELQRIAYPFDNVPVSKSESSKLLMDHIRSWLKNCLEFDGRLGTLGGDDFMLLEFSTIIKVMGSGGYVMIHDITSNKFDLWSTTGAHRVYQLPPDSLSLISWV